MSYSAPVFRGNAFHCPYCQVYAHQLWVSLFLQEGRAGFQPVKEMAACYCTHCTRHSWWYEQRLIVPSAALGAGAHNDLPPACLADYEEARAIAERSPRAAAALLRLVIQKLLIELGLPGRNLNEDIGALVQRGLPSQVQRALDVCRVVGNNAVHPGELHLQDNPEVVHQLFDLVNYIVQEQITRPRTINALFGKLPSGAVEAIQKRDDKAAGRES